MLRLLRGALVALGVAGLVAGVLRLRNPATPPITSGGWRELSGPEMS